MLTQQTSLRPQEQVVGKVMDGEAIIINLVNGMYYSMDKVGAVIWRLIEEGSRLGDIVDALCRSYELSCERAQADVERLVGELVHENLVAVSDRTEPRQRVAEPAPREKLPYEAPVLNIYSDMGDLLALDPPVPGLETSPWDEPSEES